MQRPLAFCLPLLGAELRIRCDESQSLGKQVLKKNWDTRATATPLRKAPYSH
jgi:hypothetical protein